MKNWNWFTILIWIWMYRFELPMHLYSSSQSPCTLCMVHMFSNFFENTASVKMQDGTRIFTYYKQESVWCEKRCFVQVKFKTLLLSLYKKKGLVFQSVSIVLYRSEEPSLFFWCSVKSLSCIRVCVSISDIKIKKKNTQWKTTFVFVCWTPLLWAWYFLQCEKIYWSVLELHVKLFCSRPTCNWALIESMLVFSRLSGTAIENLFLYTLSCGS